MTKRKFSFFILLAGLLLLFPMIGCNNATTEPPKTDSLELLLNSDNEYLGFEGLGFIPVEDAKNAGYIIMKDSLLTNGQEIYEDFISKSADKDAQIRICCYLTSSI